MRLAFTSRTIRRPMGASLRDEDLVSIVRASVISLPFIQALPQGSNFVGICILGSLAGSVTDEHLLSCL
jgi:hypothetical protein